MLKWQRLPGAYDLFIAQSVRGSRAWLVSCSIGLLNTIKSLMLQWQRLLRGRTVAVCISCRVTGAKCNKGFKALFLQARSAHLELVIALQLNLNLIISIHYLRVHSCIVLHLLAGYFCVPDVLQAGKEDKPVLHYTLNSAACIVVAKCQVKAVLSQDCSYCEALSSLFI